MHKHHVGDPIQFFASDGADPAPGQILRVHEDGHTCCVVAYCTESKTYKEHYDIPHSEPVDDSGPFFICPSEEDGF